MLGKPTTAITTFQNSGTLPVHRFANRASGRGFIRDLRRLRLPFLVIVRVKNWGFSKQIYMGFPPRFFRAFAVRALAAAFDAFVAISLRRSGVSFLCRASAPFRPSSEK